MDLVQKVFYKKKAIPVKSDYHRVHQPAMMTQKEHPQVAKIGICVRKQHEIYHVVA